MTLKERLAAAKKKAVLLDPDSIRILDALREVGISRSSAEYLLSYDAWCWRINQGEDSREESHKVMYWETAPKNLKVIDYDQVEVSALIAEGTFKWEYYGVFWFVAKEERFNKFLDFIKKREIASTRLVTNNPKVI